jgi:hypothetical protein
MAVVTVADVNAWLERTKIAVQSVDPTLETTAIARVFGRLSSMYDVTTWTDASTTPTLVRAMVAMHVAAWTYNRAYTEDSPDGSPYANWLLNEAALWVSQTVDGVLTLTDAAPASTAPTGPSAYPDDSTGASQQYDDSGAAIGGTTSAAAKFYMGTRF